MTQISLIVERKSVSGAFVDRNNYFNEGLTSAVVEGLNNAIRGVIRRAYGYHLFDNFRLHVMVEHGPPAAPFPPI